MKKKLLGFLMISPMLVLISIVLFNNQIIAIILGVGILAAGIYGLFIKGLETLFSEK